MQELREEMLRRQMDEQQKMLEQLNIPNNIMIDENYNVINNKEDLDSTFIATFPTQINNSKEDLIDLYVKKYNEMKNTNINQEQLKGQNLDDVKLNLKLYKMLDNINEEYEDLKSILENTINIVLDNDINNLDNYLQNNILDETTFNLLKELIVDFQKNINNFLL